MATMTFALDIAKFAEKAGKKPALVFKKIVFDMYVRIAMRTPVDTGRARGGWQVGEVLNTWQPSGLSDVDPTATGTPNKSWGALEGVQGIGGEVAFIFNNVVYIVPLEYGHSDKAPAGMVRITIAEFQAIVNAAVASTP